MTPVHSRHLGSAREVWIHGPQDAPTVLFLDGEFYRDRVGARGLIDAAVADGALPPLRVVFVAYRTPLDRHLDFACSDAYAAFVVDELLPRLGGDPAVLAGLSLSGLAVAHLALGHPQRFGRVLCQSPSAWWSDEHLAGEVRRCGVSSRVWMSVGTDELEADVRHPPTGMFQGVSQVASVTRLAEAWNASGGEALLQPFDGGHDPACWACELVPALRWLL